MTERLTPYRRIAMKYYLIRPEVAGGLGERAELDTSVHPPVVSHLHYEFEDWMGDAIVATFPCFLVTRVAERALMESSLTGVKFEAAEVTTSQNFDILYTGPRPLPEFVRLLPVGKAGEDDFGATEKGLLVISQSAYDLLSKLGIENARIQPARFIFGRLIVAKG